MSQPASSLPVGDRPAPQRHSHVWHQMTNATAWASRPGPHIVRAEGSFLWDVDGARIIDGNSGLQNVGIGHGRPEMAAVAARQIAELTTSPSTTARTRVEGSPTPCTRSCRRSTASCS